ncbi:MAG TPA: hypothetical protein VN922_20145, partial [Bacteroidia bacterium]|nr:hypothetical protein [Bacteroidia bacterium]
SNTITGLTPGLYYVTLKSAGASPYCYSTDTITVADTSVSNACPAATFCATAADPNNLFPNGTFGGGTPLNGGPLTSGKTSYQYQAEGDYSPEDGFYAIANNTYVGTYSGIYWTPFYNQWAEGWDNDHWLSGGDTGYMMIVNADYDPNIIIEDSINNLCIGKTYQFSAYIRSLNVNNGTNEPANETFLVDGIGLYHTPNLYSPIDANTTPNAANNGWTQVGFTFIAHSTSAVFSMRNNAPGGQGNDFAIDDIYMGSCVPSVSVNVFDSSVCTTPPAQDTAKIVDVSQLFSYYRWYVNKNDGHGYVIADSVHQGSFTADTTYGYVAMPSPLSTFWKDSGWIYKVAVATDSANLTDPNC